MVVIYCNTGSLSAQAVFALRLLGWDNVKVLQDGFEGWKTKGGFAANERATRMARFVGLKADLRGRPTRYGGRVAKL